MCSPDRARHGCLFPRQTGQKLGLMLPLRRLRRLTLCPASLARSRSVSIIVVIIRSTSTLPGSRCSRWSIIICSSRCLGNGVVILSGSSGFGSSFAFWCGFLGRSGCKKQAIMSVVIDDNYRIFLITYSRTHCLRLFADHQHRCI